MQKIEMNYDDGLIPPVKTLSKGAVGQIDHYEAFEVNEKTAKNQLPVIERWNIMRQCLLDNGLMKLK